MKRMVTNEEFELEYNKWQPLIKNRISRWKKMGKEDAHQTACIALWKCLGNFDPTRSKFITFLFKYMDWEYMNKMSSDERAKIKAKLNDPTDFSFNQDCAVEYKENDFVDEEINILRKYLNEQENYVLSNLLAGKKTTEIARANLLSKQRINQVQQNIRSVANDLTSRGQIRILS